jgi:hypothetical protein
MADLLTAAIHALSQLPDSVNVTPEEVCDAFWLYRQGVGEGASIAVEHVTPAKARPQSESRAGESSGAANYQEVPGSLPEDVPDTPETREYTTRVAIRGASALPKARELARALRPLRFDPLRTHRAPRINEQATAERIAATRLRDVVWMTSRRRRLDLDLILDLGGCGPLWRDLAAEVRTMLETQGAFRSIRFWDLDSDSAGLPLRHAHASGRRRNMVSYPASAICQPPRKPLVMMLTDGTGHAWQSREIAAPLRQWAAYGTVVLIQLLSAQLWERTSLSPLPVTFFPADDGYQRGRRLKISNAELYSAGVKRRELRAATAIPVIGLSPAWLRSWLPLLRGTQAGPVPGYAVVIPQAAPGAVPVPEATGSRVDAMPRAGENRSAGLSTTVLPAPGLTVAETRMLRFKLTASAEAFELAKLLSTIPINVAVMRKVKSELLPKADDDIMAEVMLGGLVYWTTAAGTLAPSDTLRLKWHDGVKELLQEWPGGVAEYEREKARVERAVAADRGAGTMIQLVVGAQTGMASETDTRTAVETTVPTAPIPTIPVNIVRPTASTKPPGEVVRIGLFGSIASGRSTFVAVLGMMFSDWTDVRRGERRQEQWRVIPATDRTREVVAERRLRLTGERQFPMSTPLPRDDGPLEFRLERRRHRRGRGGWLPPDPLATVTIVLQDRSGGQYVGAERSPEAARYLAESDALVYFFDPTYEMEPRKYHSADFFNAVDTDLSMYAARTGEERIPKYVAVCLPKLDDQRVFNLASDFECLEPDPVSGLFWVPPRKAKRLFDVVTLERNDRESDYLRTRLPRAFYARRISYHAFSSVGFWIGDDGQFDPEHVCNVVDVQVLHESRWVEESRVRGEIRPVHVLDPLILLIDRVLKRTAR